LCKDGYRPGIKILESSEGFIWLKLDAKFFNLKNDLFLCAVYFPPQYSQNHYSKKIDYFQYLSDTIIKYGNQGNVMIAGDLNSRVGTNSEESFHEIPNIDALCPEEVRVASRISQRLSCDQKVNGYGKKLLQLCQAFNLKLTNGSVPGDRQGSFTCYGNKGSSVVDYFVCDSSIFNIVSRMKVHPPEYGSVHSPISVHLDTKFQVLVSDGESLPSPPKIKWDETKAETFKKLLRQEPNLMRLKNLEFKLKCNLNKDALEACTKELTNILFSNASKSFKIVKRSKKRVMKPKSKPWYNKDCVSMKKRLSNLANLLKKSPRDPLIRGNFIKIKSEYKKLVKHYKKL